MLGASVQNVGKNALNYKAWKYMWQHVLTTLAQNVRHLAEYVGISRMQRVVVFGSKDSMYGGNAPDTTSSVDIYT